MGVNYTKEQLEAIHTIGTNILVSAGAGSGKTAVLSERVLEHLKMRCNIEELVILTFTKAAAKEMKERIRKKIKANLKTYPKLKHDLANIDLAHIKTFDSFAFFILKKYGYLKNISKQIAIADGVMINHVKALIMTEIFDEYYQANDERFFHYINQYTHKDDRALKEQIIMFSDQLNLYYEKEELMNNLSNDFFTAKHFNVLFNRYEHLVFEKIQAIKDTANHLFELALSEEAETFVDKLYDQVKPLFKADNYEGVKEAIHTIKLPPFGKKIKETLDEETIKQLDMLKSTISDQINKDLKPLCDLSKEEHQDAFYATSDHLDIIKTLIRLFDQRLETYQMEHESFEFSMVARLALDIIKRHDFVRNRLKTQIYEVLIDEYQDTSSMQESFIEAITDQNVLMVGDVKQSIYRFRHADPSLFVKKYHRYMQGDGGHLIDLNLNFRSRKEVLEAINTIFIPTMDEQVGGVDYTTSQQLQFGNKTYEEAVNADQHYGLEVLSYEETDYEELFKSFKPAQIEAFLMAYDIKHKMQSSVQTFDEGKLRKAQYGDFAILLDRKTSFDEIKQIFEYVGVPLKVHKEESFIDTEAITVLRNLLILIESINDSTLYRAAFKHAFYSVARSFLIHAKDDDCINQLLYFDEKYFDKDRIQSRFKAFFSTIEGLASKQRLLSLDTILFEVYKQFEFYQRISHLDKTDQVKSRLDALLDKAIALSQEGYLLSDFIAYLETANDSDFDIEVTTNLELDEHAVHLMSIHKSKGLEFPFVYMAHLFNNFTISSMKNYDFDAEYGFLLKHFNEGLADYFVKDLKKSKDKTEDISERLRVLYVALTRAKENLTLFLRTNQDKDEVYLRDDNDQVILRQRKNYKYFEAVLKSVKAHVKITQLNLENYSFDQAYQHVKPLESIDSNEQVKTYHTPDIPVKKIESESFSHGVSELLDKQTLDYIDLGNQLHDYLEMIDFKDDVSKQIDFYVASEDHKQILTGFFDHPLIKSLSIKQVYKEYPFIYESEGSMIQGFVDLIIETPSELLVIDYKLKTITKDYYHDQVKGYMKILRRLKQDKPIKGYLYSIIDQQFEEVNEHD